MFGGANLAQFTAKVHCRLGDAGLKQWGYHLSYHYQTWSLKIVPSWDTSGLSENLGEHKLIVDHVPYDKKIAISGRHNFKTYPFNPFYIFGEYLK